MNLKGRMSMLLDVLYQATEGAAGAFAPGAALAAAAIGMSHKGSMTAREESSSKNEIPRLVYRVM